MLFVRWDLNQITNKNLRIYSSALPIAKPPSVTGNQCLPHDEYKKWQLANPLVEYGSNYFRDFNQINSVSCYKLSLSKLFFIQSFIISCCKLDDIVKIYYRLLLKYPASIAHIQLGFTFVNETLLYSFFKSK